MSIPKQDERTPGRRYEVRDDVLLRIVYADVAVACFANEESREHVDQVCRLLNFKDEKIAKLEEQLASVNAYTSTEALRSALMLAEKADRIHSKCQECEDGAQAPEACEHCFPSADDARVARRNVLKALGVKMRDVDRASPDAARAAQAGVTAPTAGGAK